MKGKYIKEGIWKHIKDEQPDLERNEDVPDDIYHRCRVKYIQSILMDKNGTLSKADMEVTKTIANNSLISDDTDADLAKLENPNYGERLADKIAEFGGSWKFIIIFMVVLILWMILNALVLSNKGFDPYPFILLNLVLSSLAAFQAPVIMMSQNRQQYKDRIRSDYDFKVNLKSEIEIRLLHEKLDFIISQMNEFNDDDEVEPQTTV